MSQARQYLTDEHGDRTAVVLPISEYKKLLEDLTDLAVVAERRDEPIISHDEFLADLKRDSLSANGLQFDTPQSRVSIHNIVSTKTTKVAV